MAKAWTKKDDAQLTKLFSAALTTIGKTIGRSPSSVEKRLYEIQKLKSNPPEKKTVPFSNAKGGIREDIPGRPKVRSGWEANVLRVLEHSGYKWEYEPEVFWFRPIKKGTVAYTPDIKVYDGKDYFWIEVKGYLDNRSKTKINRLRIYYPEEFARLKVVIKNDRGEAQEFFDKLGVPVWAYYDDLKREYKPILPSWEGI